jgi:hypothetical protein
LTTEIILLQVGAVLYNLVNAAHDARRINNSQFINHGKNGLLYGLYIITCVLFSSSTLLAVALLSLRPLIFDQALNVMRKLPLNYQPVNPDSAVDRLENGVFGHKRAWMMSNMIYLIMWAAGNYFITRPEYEILTRITEKL